MAIFLVDGRDSDGEPAKVTDAEGVTVRTAGGCYEGVTTMLTEHSLRVYLDDGQALSPGTHAEIALLTEGAPVTVKGVVTGITESRSRSVRTHTIELLDFCGSETEYWQILYDRVPTLPQSLHRDFGVLPHLWQNIAHRVARTIRQ
jgi:cellulose synthase (UDP-forming)